MRGLTLLALFGVCLGQKPARIGPDGKPLLNRPDLAECMKSKCEGWAGPTLIMCICREISHESWEPSLFSVLEGALAQVWGELAPSWPRPGQTWRPTSRMLRRLTTTITSHHRLIFRTGTGSMGAISAEIVAWISCLSIHPESSRCFPRSWREVGGCPAFPSSSYLVLLEGGILSILNLLLPDWHFNNLGFIMLYFLVRGLHSPGS